MFSLHRFLCLISGCTLFGRQLSKVPLLYTSIVCLPQTRSLGSQRSTTTCCSKNLLWTLFFGPFVHGKDCSLIDLVGKFHKKDVKGKTCQNPTQYEFHPFRPQTPWSKGLKKQLDTENPDQNGTQLVHCPCLYFQGAAKGKNNCNADKVEPWIRFTKEFVSWCISARKVGLENDRETIGEPNTTKGKKRNSTINIVAKNFKDSNKHLQETTYKETVGTPNKDIGIFKRSRDEFVCQCYCFESSLQNRKREDKTVHQYTNEVQGERSFQHLFTHSMTAFRNRTFHLPPRRKQTIRLATLTPLWEMTMAHSCCYQLSWLLQQVGLVLNR